MDSVILTPSIENQKPIPVCSKCGGYLLFSLSSEDPEKVEINCPNCYHKEKLPLEDVISFLVPSNKELHEKHKDKFTIKCEFKKDSCSQIASQYCIDCGKWSCENCQKLHLHFEETKNHVTDELISKLCRKHKEPYNLYCDTCKLNLCSECLKVHDHKHQDQIIETKKLFETSNIQKYNDFLRSMREHSSNFVSLFQKIIKMIDNYKTEITEAFNKTCKINQNINSMYKNFVEHASRNRNNYYILENLERFAVFAFKNFKFPDSTLNLQTLTGKDLIDYKNYVAEGAILVEKKTSSFEGLQRTKEWTFEHFISSLNFYIPSQDKAYYFVLGFNNGNLGILKEIPNAKKESLFLAKESHKGRILSIHLSNNFIYTSGFDQIIKKWEIIQKRISYEIEYKACFRGHKDEVRLVLKVPNQNTIISCSGDGKVIIWEDIPNSLVINPKQIINVQSSVTSILLCKDNKHLLVSTCANDLIMYSLKDYQKKCSLEDIYCCSTGCLSYVGDFVVAYGNKTLTTISIKDEEMVLENVKKFNSENDSLMGITDVMFSIIPVGKEEIMISNLKKSIFKINLKNDKIQVKEFSGKESIEGLYEIFSKKFAIVFGKRVEILSH